VLRTDHPIDRTPHPCDGPCCEGESADGAPVSRAALRQVLVDHYADLHRRLSRRLGADLACETLHDLYLRLDRPGPVAALRNPLTYIVTAAVNLARDRCRTENRRGRRVVADALHHLVDESPGPDRIVEDRSEFVAFTRAFDRITPRQRAIVVALRFERMSRPDVAKRLNISRSLVQLELQRALQSSAVHLADRRCR